MPRISTPSPNHAMHPTILKQATPTILTGHASILTGHTPIPTGHALIHEQATPTILKQATPPY